MQHKLPGCKGLDDELVIMEEILDWSVRAQANEEDEAKLVLWWHLLLRLAIRQVQFHAKSLTGTINILSHFTSHLNHLIQERMGKGLLGALGLGRKSPLSLKMRLLARSLSAFITSQVLSADTLRTHPSSGLVSNQAVADFRALRKNKSYAQFLRTIDKTISFLQDTNRTILDALVFLSETTRDLYENKQFLCDVIKQVQ
jgi:hypothetical protein